jgi:hypothetical protein
MDLTDKRVAFVDLDNVGCDPLLCAIFKALGPGGVVFGYCGRAYSGPLADHRKMSRVVRDAFNHNGRPLILLARGITGAKVCVSALFCRTLV